MIERENIFQGQGKRKNWVAHGNWSGTGSYSHKVSGVQEGRSNTGGNSLIKSLVTIGTKRKGSWDRLCFRAGMEGHMRKLQEWCWELFAVKG